MATSRNRIIYQSQALFIAPSSTGYHIQTGVQPIQSAAQCVIDDNIGSLGTGSYDDPYNFNWTGTAARHVSGMQGSATKIHMAVNRSLIEPMERIQSANFNFTLNKTDVNEFGRLSRLDSIVLESPTVGLDFNYYLTDGGNERKMGFNIPTSDAASHWGSRALAGDPMFWTGDGCLKTISALSGLLDDSQGNNYFIAVVPDGKDVQGTTDVSTTGTDFTKNDVICIGNGFLSDYTVEAAVGAIPTASCTIEGFNIKVDSHLSGANQILENQSTSSAAAIFLDEGVPGVSLEGTSGTNRYVFGTGIGNTGTQYGSDGWMAQGTSFNTTGNAGFAALRPGDLTFEMGQSGSYIGFTDMDGAGAAHIQSFTINVPLSRTVLQKLGSTFGYARVVDLPVDISCTVSAVVSELQNKNLIAELCSTQTHDFTLTLKDPACITAGNQKLKYTVKNARLDSETFTNAIGDNETVDMTFTTQIGGANDTTNGLFMEGAYPRYRTLPYWPLGKSKQADAAYKGAHPTAWV